MGGWENDALEVRPVIGEWDQTVREQNGFNTLFSFYIIEGHTNVII